MSNWYEIVTVEENISQGDIFFNCPVFKVEPTIDKSSADYIGDVNTVIDCLDIVVMNQACDLEDCSIQNVVVAPLWNPLTALPSASKGKLWELISSIHAGRRPNYSLIGKSTLKVDMDYKIVDFSQILTIPYDFLMSFREHHGNRLRLNTPHRELLSQQFGNYFARIGLPNDDHIDKKQLKQDLDL